MMGLAGQIKRWDDLTREFARLARRFELQATAALTARRHVTASDGFLAASVVYGAAQWPIFENTELNDALERKKTTCYAAYIPHADHRIEAVEVPFGDRSVPGLFHLPPGHVAGEKLPCLVMVSGMDAFKELQICASADRFLRRGFRGAHARWPGTRQLPPARHLV